METDVDLGKISIVPKGDWNDQEKVEYNDIWRYNSAKYLAIKESQGVIPSDDKVYWYELSSQGKSAYQQAVEDGFTGSEAEWLQSLKQPAIDAATQAAAAVERIDERFPQKMDEIKSELSEKISQEVVDRVVKPIVISSKEEIIGSFKVGGESHDLYARSFQLNGLPKTSGETKEYIIADEPLGFGLYFNVESFTASTGKGLNKEFFNFNYEVVRFYINDSLQSCIVVKCKNTMSEEANGVLYFQYCKFWGDVVEFDVTVPEGIDKEAISLEIPKLKFNKKMVFSYITDDSNNIYQYIFSSINKRYIAKKFGPSSGGRYGWHLGMQGKPQFEQYVSEAFYPEHFCQCTDGAGVKRRYATTVSVWPDKLYDGAMGKDVGMQYPWMSEKEFKLYFDFGFMVAYHDLIGYDADTDTQDKFNKCVSDTAALFKQYVDIVPKHMVEPNGDHKYIPFSRANDIMQFITAQSGHTSIKKVYPFRPNFTLGKNDVTIERLFGYGSDLNAETEDPQYSKDLMNILHGFEAATDKNSIYWLIGSAHASSYWEAFLIKKIHEAFGDIGSDSLWFPTSDELYEYWYMRENTLSVKTITDAGVHFKMFVPQGANFFFRDLSVLLSGITSLTGVNVTSGDNVFGTSFAINDSKLLVNLNFNRLLMERVNKYVTAFEADYNKEYAYDDAYYFVQMLKPGLKEPYLTRINKWVSPPTLKSFSINEGQDTTQNQSVTLNITYTGQAPTHYMASENSGFTGAQWIDYVENPTFKLSDEFNEKTVYIKLKNVYGETGALSDKITLLEPTLALTSIAINNGDASTTQRNISLSFSYTGFPTHYMVSEDPTFSGSSWVEFAENPAIQLSESFGNKILYAKLKNEITETLSRSATIELIDAVTARLNSISINNGSEFTGSGTVDVKFDTMNTITKYKIGKQSDLSDCPDWITWVGSTVSFNSGISEGALSVYAQVANATTESAIKFDSITVVRPIVMVGLILANGDNSFAGLNVPVSFDVSQGTPTHYRLAETASALTSAPWLAWKTDILYTFASLGAKTLYGQVKNQVSESITSSDSITLTEPPVMALIGMNGATNNTVDYPVVNGLTFNQIKGATHTGFGAGVLKDTQGNNLPWYFNMNTNKYLPNSIFNQTGANDYESISTAVDGGVYPAATFKLSRSVHGNSATGDRKFRMSFTLPAGNYKARILMSPSNSFIIEQAAWLARSFYAVYKGEELLAKTGIGSTGFTGSGNNQFNAQLTFQILETGDVDFAAWMEGTPLVGYRPGYNLIELTKIS